MTSLIPTFPESNFYPHLRLIGLMVITSALCGGALQAQASFESNKTEITYFNDFRLTPAVNESRDLSIGIDLLHAENFNYSDSSLPVVSHTASSASSPKWYRGGALIMGIIFVLVTFSQGMLSLLKNANQTRVPV